VIARPWSSGLTWTSPLPAIAAALALGLVLGVAAGLGSPLLALAGLLGGAISLMILRAPVYGLDVLVALAFLLPFAVIPIRLSAQLTALEAILGLTAGATVLRGLVRRERLRPGPVEWLHLGILGLATMSFLLSLPYAGGAETARRFAKLMLAMLAFPLTIRLVGDERRLDRLLVTLMLCGGLEAAIGVALYWVPHDTSVGLLSGLGPLGYPTGPDILRFLPGENDTYTDILRATGTSIDPNVLGGELMLAAALLVTQLCSSKPLLPRWMLLPLASLAVVGMLLSHSRSSWIGLTTGMLCLATLRYRRLWLAIVPAAIGLALLPAGRALSARVLAGFAGQDKAAAMRLDEYRNALEIVRQYPLFGIGFGGPPAIDLAPGVSSIYLTVAETMGVPALALFSLALAWLFGRAVRALHRPTEPLLQGGLSGLLAALLAALAAGLFDHYFASAVFPHMVALFWLCCGLLWRATDLARGD
jgi:hypothetical protein